MGTRCWLVLSKLLVKVFLKPCSTSKSRLARPFNMTIMSITEPMKELPREPTASLFQPSDATLTVRGLRRIVIELPKVFQVPVAPPLQHLRARQASSPRGTVWHGIREDVARTAKPTSMKPRSLETKVVNSVVVPLTVRVLPYQRVKGKRACKFWKQGRCDRGAECNFLHEGSAGKPRQATPARSASGDFENKKKAGKNSKRKGSRSSSRSKGPESPKSPKSKGSGSISSKPSPAAAYLVASMLASVSQAICIAQPRVFCPSVRFDDSPDVTRVKARGNLRPLGNNVTTGKVTFLWGHPFEVDETAASDAALVGTMLAGSVSNCLEGVDCKCAYFCDTDFGCDHCIPKGITATAAECKDDVKGAINFNLDWIADTSSAQVIVTVNYLVAIGTTLTTPFG